ncbi:SNF2-related protein [Halonatronum saccharophilum]|uniref:SNF2-related protein n=1 Tax=Halonatronum saccharophilum TaxID=150060 RepID=UPI0004870A35|nr:SNF2-related protein [Halonatronum saccharophilum]
MNLLKQLKDQVSTKIFKRGERYYKAGKIDKYNLIDLDNNRYNVQALVWGTVLYTVDIDFVIDNEELQIYGGCTCPYWGDICKHQVAVLYKFFQERANAQTPRKMKSSSPKKKLPAKDESFEKLLQITQDFQDTKHPQITYKVKGLIRDSMVNFKLTLESEELLDDRLDQIVDYLHQSHSYYYRDTSHIDKLSIKDQNNLNYFKGIDLSKSPTPGGFFFPKNKDNFNFLVSLIKNNEVYLEENSQRAKIGEELSPDLFIRGDEKEVDIKVAHRHKFQQREGAQWTVVDSKVHTPANSLNLNLPPKIKIPKEGRGKFIFEVLPQLKTSFKTHFSSALEGYTLIKDKTEVELEFDYQKGIISCRAKVIMDNKEYGNSEIIAFDPTNRDYRQDEDDPKFWFTHDLEPVKELLDFLEEYNFRVKPDSFYIKERDDIQEFITDGLTHIPEDWEINTSQEFDEVEVVEVELNPIIEFEEDDGGINWFEFKVSYNLGGNTYTPEELKKLLRYNKHNRKYIQVGNKYLLLQETLQEKNLKKIIEGADSEEEGIYRSNYYNLLYYQSLVEESGISFKGSKVYNSLNEDITANKLVQEEEIPAGVEEILRGYQKKGYYWMKFLHKYNFGGILADDMGLGKTIQALTLIKGVEKKAPVLIVCPRTLIYNWAAEIEKFFPGTDYLVYYGTPDERKEMREELDKYEILVTTYSIMSRDYEDLQEVEFSYTLLDEAHNIKNRQAKRTKGIKRIKSRYKLALTGTPLENSLDELWSIFDFLMPGYLGKYSKFRKKYLNPITKEDDKEKLEDLKRRIAPFILRRRKEEVLDDLPQKMINTYPVEMTSFQEQTYKAIVEEVKKDLVQKVEEDGFNKSRINILAALTKLRQICNHPDLVLEEKGKRRESGKLEALLELIEEATLAGHKLIVFSQFVGMLKLIRERLEEKGVSFEYLDGSTRKRMERVERFNESKKIKVFLISLKAGGVGLNLTSADVVVHVDPWWNPMVERQATDRAHRIGQKKKVIVYKMITTGTVEEKMLKLQEKKKDIFENIIEDNARPTDKITWDDIQQLLE